MEDTEQDDIEAEVAELIEKMEADIDASARSQDPVTDQDSKPSYEPLSPAPWFLDGQPFISNEAYYKKKISIDSVEMAGATLVGLPSDRNEKYERLEKRQYQTDNEHSTRLSRLDKKRITQALCGHLDLTPHQQNLTIERMMELDLGQFGSQKRIVNVALAVIRDIVEADRRPDIRPEEVAELSEEELERLYEGHKRMSDDKRYNALLDEFDLDLNDIQQITKVLREQ